MTSGFSWRNNFSSGLLCPIHLLWDLEAFKGMWQSDQGLRTKTEFWLRKWLEYMCTYSSGCNYAPKLCSHWCEHACASATVLIVSSLGIQFHGNPSSLASWSDCPLLLSATSLYQSFLTIPYCSPGSRCGPQQASMQSLARPHHHFAEVEIPQKLLCFFSWSEPITTGDEAGKPYVLFFQNTPFFSLVSWKNMSFSFFSSWAGSV